jgi:hypothetical protein
MQRRPWFVRLVTFLFATVQLVAPGATAIADGLAHRDGAGEPVVHIEATTRATCPQVHSPDCGLCRFLSSLAARPASSPTPFLLFAAGVPAASAEHSPISRTQVSLPPGRGPPPA